MLNVCRYQGSPNRNQQPFIQMIDQILLAQSSKQKADTSETEAEIDDRVYQLYGLTPLEISAVEERL